MPIDRTPPRLSVEITDEQFRDLQRLIPHGLKTPLFRVLIDDLIVLLEGENPHITIGAFLTNKVIFDITNQRRKDEPTNEKA